MLGSKFKELLCSFPRTCIGIGRKPHLTRNEIYYIEVRDGKGIEGMYKVATFNKGWRNLIQVKRKMRNEGNEAHFEGVRISGLYFPVRRIITEVGIL